MASIPQVLFVDLSALTFSASAGSFTGYPLVNLNDPDPARFWKASLRSPNQVLQVDFGAPTAVNRIYLGHHNLDSVGGDTILQYSHSGTGWTNAHTIYAASASGDYSGSFTGGTYQKWRLLFSADVEDRPYLGLFYLGVPLSFGDYPNGPITYDDVEYASAVSQNIQGATRVSQAALGRLRFRVGFRLLTDAFRDDFAEFLGGVRGRLFPFLYVDDRGVSRYVRFTQDYNPADLYGYNLNDLVGLEMVSQGVGSWAGPDAVIPTWEGMYPDYDYVTTVEGYIPD